LQALDEEYLKVDAQFGGVDQRKIFTFAEKVRFLVYFILPQLSAPGSLAMIMLNIHNFKKYQMTVHCTVYVLFKNKNEASASGSYSLE